MQREREKNKYHQVPIEIPLDNSLLKPATIPACLGRGWTTNCFCLPLLFFYLSRSIVGLSETSHPLSSYTKMHQARRQKGDLIQVAQDSPFRPRHTLSLKIKRRLSFLSPCHSSHYRFSFTSREEERLSIFKKGLASEIMTQI